MKYSQVHYTTIYNMSPSMRREWIEISTRIFGSFANVGVVKSICKQVQTAAYQGSNHGISATGGFTSHGYSCRNRVSFVN